MSRTGPIYFLLLIQLLLFCSVKATPSDGYNISYIVSDSIDFKNTRQYTWIPQGKSAPNVGINSGALWVKVQLDSVYEYLVIENAHLDSVNIYFVAGDSIVQQVEGGDRTPFYNRSIPFHYINFRIPTNTQTIFLRSRSEGSSATPVVLLKASEMGYFLDQLKLNWAYFGILLLTAVFNFIFGVFLKEKTYLFYSLYLLGLIFTFLTDFGYIYQYVYPAFPDVNQYVPIFYCSLLFSMIFAHHYLNISGQITKLRYAFWFVYVIFLIVVIATFFDYSLAINLFSLIFLMMPFLIIVSAIRTYSKQRSKPVLIFIFAWTCYSVTLTLYALSAFNVLPYNTLWLNLVMLGSVSEVVILQFAVLYRINELKEDNIRHKLKVLDLMQEREKILLEHNTNLEQTVYLRTMEVKEVTEEVIAQNEMLQEQQQELEEQHEKLAVQNKLIEEVNALLREKHKQLEGQVFDRTIELSSTNEELSEKNHRLEQFAYVAAHNLRGPVATLLGLSQLARFEFMKNNKIDELKYIDSFETTSEKLDSVIKGLSFILDLEKNMAGLSAETNLNNVVDDIEVLLKSEIQNSGCIIHKDFSSCENIHVIPVYLNNILYNLLSNSIKYQQEGISPEVWMKCYRSNDEIQFEYRDNSMGIDLEMAGDKLFMPFKRFTQAKTGIGLGLYMIKVQIEAMKGKIKLHSAPGAGVHYSISFKPNK